MILFLAAITRFLFNRVLGADDPPFGPVMGKRGEAGAAPAAAPRGAGSSSNGATTVTVADDGVGGADPARGSGLRGLAARVEALNGRLDVDSAPGRGTRISAEIPSPDM